MKTGMLVLPSAALFLLAAKAHGRELRIEREVAGFAHVVFGAPDNPPFVEALWHRERLYFWALTAGLGLAAGVKLVKMDAPLGLTALVLLTWVPAVSFFGLGLASLARKGLTAEGAGGSAAWWSLVLVAFTASALVARSHWRAA
jgi:hypothetical protein